jgi:hypothetical protein
MRCSASPTTSTAVEPRAAAARTLEALVFREILKPLTAGMGPVAELALGPLADRLAGVPKR